MFYLLTDLVINLESNIFSFRYYLRILYTGHIIDNSSVNCKLNNLSLL